MCHTKVSHLEMIVPAIWTRWVMSFTAPKALSYHNMMNTYRWLHQVKSRLLLVLCTCTMSSFNLQGLNSHRVWIQQNAFGYVVEQGDWHHECEAAEIKFCSHATWTGMNISGPQRSEAVLRVWGGHTLSVSVSSRELYWEYFWCRERKAEKNGQNQNEWKEIWKTRLQLITTSTM